MKASSHIILNRMELIFMDNKKLSQPEKWLIFGIPALFVIGGIMHFIYDLTGKVKVMGMFVPVNESIWEHLKMLLLPIIGWWSVYYFINHKKYDLNKDKWFFASVVSIVISMLITLAFYYTYTQAFGIESLVLDIFDLLLSITIGQLIGSHIYKYGKGIKSQISICILILLIAIFAAFTFNPPHIPLFKDSMSGQYGV